MMRQSSKFTKTCPKLYHFIQGGAYQFISIRPDSDGLLSINVRSIIIKKLVYKFDKVIDSFNSIMFIIESR